MNLFLGILFLVVSIEAHSWIHCVDYRIQSPTDEEVYDPAKCLAYPRGWKDCCADSTFGEDRGYNYQPGTGAPCAQSIPNPLSSGYSDAVPMAEYTPGQRICLTWPPKNHVAATCINENIPDNGLKIYMYGPNPTDDPSTIGETTMIHDFGVNPGADAYEGFQNCPRFCDEPDKALCTGCFDLPNTLVVGATYTFYWEWKFNNPSDIYANCWDAKIVGSTGGQLPTSQETSQNNPGQTSQSKEETSSQGQTTIGQQCDSHDDCYSGICKSDRTCHQECYSDEDCDGNICTIEGVCRSAVGDSHSVIAIHHGQFGLVASLLSMMAILIVVLV